ncbi:FecR family protein [Chthonomonas calidirosea]|uniref:FecR family protein n=1 Tax=Chthonomonas calidirosea (strain DSM 23976 / ICMP 18418 / T49) TaxID=1303518 RepID=S0ETW9_CHTCT|nr:DUF6600 domain-containing protein [Chthonomonas calidirosea]CCW34984.1 FecR family protein [Chthonomonas calidirosea T49]CEK21001.1 FecR family protein [Chthonomonas calidirosea]
MRKRCYFMTVITLLMAVAFTLLSRVGFAQDDGQGYRIQENGSSTFTPSTPSETTLSPSQQNEAGAVRLARFSYVEGNVTWRPSTSADWSYASVNLPIRQGAQVWVTDGGRAEIQFDDGSLLRLGGGALATLQTLYSDSQGEFTQIILTNGLATMVTRHAYSIYQIDTPDASIKVNEKARVRVGVGDGVEVCVQEGRAVLDGEQGEAELRAGDYVFLRSIDSPYNVHPAPPEDEWDLWNDHRDRVMLYGTQHLPPNIGLVAGDLDDYGDWRYTPNYGYVWCPHITRADWRPYCDGHWVWVVPFGWTWVSDEPWGWAPYHYGTWVYEPFGWAWVPGPACQYWQPAVVDFSVCEDRVIWAPLAPEEVRYPSTLTIAFAHGDWAAYFSIAQAAVYYPVASSYCVPRPFDTVYVNQVTYINNVTNINEAPPGVPLTAFQRFQQTTEYYAATHLNRGSVLFVPRNARRAPGATYATLATFREASAYHPLPPSEADLFARGQAPETNQSVEPIAGPPSVLPTPLSFIPVRSRVPLVTPPSALQTRAVFHAPTASVRGRVGIEQTTPTNPSHVLPPLVRSYRSGSDLSEFSPSRSRDFGVRASSPAVNGTTMPPSEITSRVRPLSPSYLTDRRAPGRVGNYGTNENRAADAAALARRELGFTPSQPIQNGQFQRPFLPSERRDRPSVGTSPNNRLSSPTAPTPRFTPSPQWPGNRSQQPVERGAPPQMLPYTPSQFHDDRGLPTYTPHPVQPTWNPPAVPPRREAPYVPPPAPSPPVYHAPSPPPAPHVAPSSPSGGGNHASGGSSTSRDRPKR